MKKFSEFNKTNKIDESKSKQDFITNLVEETLYVENGTIKGKDVLVETINNIIKMNDHKNTVFVLENIKSVSYTGGLNFKWLNETIELEKSKMEEMLSEKKKVDCEECVECEDCEEDGVEEELEDDEDDEDCGCEK